MMLSNFLFRVRQYVRDNEAKLIRRLFYILIALALIFLIAGGVSRWHQWRYEKRVHALEKELGDADQKAKDAEARADVLKRAIDDKYDELKELSARADAAENALRNAKTKVVTLEKNYETIRYTPMPDIPVSLDDVCGQLSRLGYECR